jgi:CPA2 family monovalent cation:H+ antiporter-2
VGLLIQPRAVLSHLSLLAVMLGLIIVGKLLIWTLIALLFRYKLPVALFVGAGLTQIGEFSFILVQVARQHQLVGDDVYVATLAASLISILINAALMKHLPRWLPQS